MLRRNVLIFQMGGLGDFVLTWPFAVALGRIYPQSRIIYVTHQQRGDLAKRVLRLEATDAEAGWHALFAEDGELPVAAKLMLESAHAVYSFLPVTPTWRENVKRIAQLSKRVEIDMRLPAEFAGHLTDCLVDSLQNYPPERSALEQMLRSVADRGIGFKPTGGDDVVIHPGSGSPTKRWPLDRYLELADHLRASAKTVRFVIGEVEREHFTAQEIQTLKVAGTLRDCSTCLDLLNELSTAAAFIGNDSGPAHLAGIIGVPTVVLFGPTNPANWKPLGPAVHVLHNQSIQNLSMSEVLQAVENCLSSIPKKKEKNEVTTDD